MSESDPPVMEAPEGFSLAAVEPQSSLASTNDAPLSPSLSEPPDSWTPERDMLISFYTVELEDCNYDNVRGMAGVIQDLFAGREGRNELSRWIDDYAAHGPRSIWALNWLQHILLTDVETEIPEIAPAASARLDALLSELERMVDPPRESVERKITELCHSDQDLLSADAASVGFYLGCRLLKARPDSQSVGKSEELARAIQDCAPSEVSFVDE